MTSSGVVQHTYWADEAPVVEGTEPVLPTRLVRGWTLAQRFMLASLVVLVISMTGLGWWVGQQIESGVVHRTASTTTVYLDSFVAPQLQVLSDTSSLPPERIEALDRLLTETPLGRQVISFKVWGPGGQVIYSPVPELMGHRFEVGDDQARAWQGEITGHISDLQNEENALERQYAPRLLETYSPVYAHGTNRVIAVAEFYQGVAELESEIAVAQRNSWFVVGGATAAMYLLLAGIVRRGSDTIIRQQRELEEKVISLTHLLEQNNELSERVRLAASRTTALNEQFLHRISAELHDGPAQDLSYALLRLDSVVEANVALARLERGALPGVSAPSSDDGAELAKIQMSLNRAMGEIRSISAGLRLPELNGLSLMETVSRVVQFHERRTETSVDVTYRHLPARVTLPLKITVYRVVEEALNNAFRHGGGIEQRVSLIGGEGYLELTVSDRGRGFRALPAINGEGHHLGLVGMRERVESLGGRFHIESAVGEGTTLRAWLPRHPKELIDDDGRR